MVTFPYGNLDDLESHPWLEEAVRSTRRDDAGSVAVLYGGGRVASRVHVKLTPNLWGSNSFRFDRVHMPIVAVHRRSALVNLCREHYICT